MTTEELAIKALPIAKAIKENSVLPHNWRGAIIKATECVTEDVRTAGEVMGLLVQKIGLTPSQLDM